MNFSYKIGPDTYLKVGFDLETFPGLCGAGIMSGFYTFVINHLGQRVYLDVEPIVEPDIIEEIYQRMWEGVKKRSKLRNWGRIILTDTVPDKVVDEHLNCWRLEYRAKNGLKLYDFAKRKGFTQFEEFKNPNTGNTVAMFIQEV